MYTFKVIPPATLRAVNRQWLYPLLVVLDTVLYGLVGASWAPVRVLTAAALPANTWSLATNTKTANANGALTIDGVAMAAGDRFWDNHDAVGLRRGLFVVVSAGGAGAPWIARRAADADASADFTDGKTFAIQEGTSAGQVRQFTNNAPFVLNTDTPAIAVPADMVTLTTAQTITGAKTFAHLALILRNAAGTFATTFSTLASAARSVVWPDRAGHVTIATSADTQIGAGALSVSTETSFVETSAAGTVFSLANGEYTGQRKVVKASVVTNPGVDTAVITPAAGAATTLRAVGESVTYEWNGAAWVVIQDGRALVGAATSATAGTNVAEERSGMSVFPGPIAAELISVSADAALAADGARAIAGQPDCPRGLAVRVTIAVNPVTAGTLDLVGVGPSGEAVTESISLITAVSATILSNRAFARVTSATVNGLVGAGGAGDNLSVGVSAKLGLTGCKTPASSAFAVHKASIDNADEAVGAVSAAYGTIIPTTAPDGTKTFQFWYTFACTPTQNAHTHFNG